MQQVTPNIGDAFGPVEQALRVALIPALFQGLVEVTPGRGVTQLHVKQGGLALPDPKKNDSEELEDVLYDHRTYRCSNQGPGGVTYS